MLLCSIRLRYRSRPQYRLTQIKHGPEAVPARLESLSTNKSGIGVVMDQTDLRDLREQAESASRQARAPYSGLFVGAALRSASGRIHRGCNVENGALPLGSCAERGAIAAAVLAEGPDFGLMEIAVVAKTADGIVQAVSPCGACRQLIAESGPTARVGFYSANNEWIIASTAELLPYAFVLPDS